MKSIGRRTKLGIYKCLWFHHNGCFLFISYGLIWSGGWRSYSPPTMSITNYSSSLWISDEMNSDITEIISSARLFKSLCMLWSRHCSFIMSTFYEMIILQIQERSCAPECFPWPLDLNIPLPLQWVQKDNVPRNFSPHSSKFWKQIFSNLDLV